MRGQRYFVLNFWEVLSYYCDGAYKFLNSPEIEPISELWSDMGEVTLFLCVSVSPFIK